MAGDIRDDLERVGDMEEAGHVRGDEQVLKAPERTVRRKGFALRDVYRSRRDLAVFQCIEEDFVFHGVSPAAVYEDGGLFHEPEALRRIYMVSGACPGQYREHYIGLRQDLVESVHRINFIYALGAGGGAALYADHIRAQRLAHLRVSYAYLSESHDKHGAVGYRADLALIAPEVFVLVVPVQIQLFLHREGDGQRVLGDGLVVSAGGVAEDRAPGEHAGLYIGVRSGGGQLHEFKPGRFLYERGDQVSDYHVGGGDLPGAHPGAGEIRAESEAAALSGLLYPLPLLLFKRSDYEHIGHFPGPPLYSLFFIPVKAVFPIIPYGHKINYKILKKFVIIKNRPGRGGICRSGG